MDWLPAELRLTIYSLTWEPRCLLVHPRPPPGYHATRTYTHSFALFRISSPPPVTLHINFESREATLREYVPLYQTPNVTVYIHPALDTLHLIAPRGGLTPQGERPWIRQFLSAAAHITYLSADPISDLAVLEAANSEAEVSSSGANAAEPADDVEPQQTSGPASFPSRSLPLTIDFYSMSDIKLGARDAVMWHRYCRTPGCEVPCWDSGTTPISHSSTAMAGKPRDVPRSGGWRYHVFKPLDDRPNPAWSNRYFPFRSCGEVPGKPLPGPEPEERLELDLDFLAFAQAVLAGPEYD